MKSSLNEIKELCVTNDIILLQETWLTEGESHVLANICPDFYAKSISGMDTSNGILRGRPHGGIGILWKKTISSYCKIVDFNDSRIMGLEVCIDLKKMFIINVYLPCDTNDNADSFIAYLSKLDSIITDFESPYVFCCGDFNANIGSDIRMGYNSFGKELIKFCKDEGLVLSDQVLLKGDNIYTFYSQAHHTVSWLDHIMSTVNAHSLVKDIEVRYEYVTSDHLPICMRIGVDEIKLDPCQSSASIKGGKINWETADAYDLALYRDKCHELLSKIVLDHDLILCDDTNCQNNEHIDGIDKLYTAINDCLLDASADLCIRNTHKKFKPIIGWNDICRESHNRAREAFLFWRSMNKPRFGPVFDIMRRSRAQFKQTLRQCKAQEKQLVADSVARNLMAKDTKAFWKEIQKINGKNCMPLSSTINGVSGHGNIAKLWHDYFKGLLNTSKSNQDYLKKFSDTHIQNSLVSPLDVSSAIKDLKTGKSSGLDGITPEHYKYASENVSVLLSIVFNRMIIHGYLPSSFMDTVIVPVVKNKKDSITDQDNYRPIAIANSCSKILELIILNVYKDFLITKHNQFGFKRKHGTDMGVFALKSIIDYYTSLSSCIYICFIDASKAFDRISHCTLFDKLLKRAIPKIIVRFMYVWYSTQNIFVRWGETLSAPFHVSNGVRQGGILSPALFNVYLDDLSEILIRTNVGCNINGTCVNHLVYADDTVLIAPSPMALQELLNCCAEFASNHDIIYNAKKTVVMCVKSKKFNDIYVPAFSLRDKVLRVVTEEKYLGFVVSDDCKDDNDITRQMRSLYSRGNMIVKNFKHCSEDVKIQLFKAYCNNLYCGQLWCNFRMYTFNKIRVAFNNVFRALMGLRRDSSISEYMVKNDLDTFQVLYRKVIGNFRDRILKSENAILQTIIDSLFFQSSKLNMKWTDVLYLF